MDGMFETVAFACDKRDFEAWVVMKTEYHVIWCHNHDAQDKRKNTQNTSQFNSEV
uniref:Uncharacterized protein n=1 Tax=Romanomermis culicivorax TaxID=13658 RepID=A0A915KRK1_ROMCU